VNTLDYAVLFASIAAIALYGILRTRGKKNLHDYLRGKKHSWFVIGLSVMATQASAITFLSTPGQGYDGGLAFVQNYFALPLALVIISAFFLPLYQKLNVYTAYEFLGKRFDTKTRLLAASLFLLQRGMGAGLTLYAPAIVLSTVFGWSLQLTILSSGIVVIAYTVVGGSDAVTHTQKYQLAIIFAAMIAAFVILVQKIPCSFTDSLALAGHFGKLNAVSFSTDPKQRYTFWTGMLGGLFLMLSYFGADQSQVQRYISGDNVRESRLGLMFNALLKIPMQFGILLLGVLLFVFYQFHPAPIFFNKVVWQSTPAAVTLTDPVRTGGEPVRQITLGDAEAKFEEAQLHHQRLIKDWLSDHKLLTPDREKLLWVLADDQSLAAAAYRDSAITAMKKANPSLSTNDNDYVFITFILDNLPHGLIGLLVTAFFSAALSSKAAELNALASTTTIDFYRHLRRTGAPPPPHAPALAAPEEPRSDSRTLDYARIENRKLKIENGDDSHLVRASKLFTILWGIIALAFALFFLPHFGENLIQATNIVGSLFYGVILALFLIAFFLKFITGTPTFLAALGAQALVLVMYFTLNISYLWYNLIGCLACIALAAILQPFFPKTTAAPAFEVLPPTPSP
jgi:SSS family transporter